MRIMMVNSNISTLLNVFKYKNSLTNELVRLLI